MTVAQIIDEIGELDAGAQDEVIHFAVTLAASRRLSGRELHDLAAQLPGASGSREEMLREELERGFSYFECVLLRRMDS